MEEECYEEENSRSYFYRGRVPSPIAAYLPQQVKEYEGNPF